MNKLSIMVIILCSWSIQGGTQNSSKFLEINPFVNFRINKMSRNKLEWAGRWHPSGIVSSVKPVDLEFLLPSFADTESTSTQLNLILYQLKLSVSLSLFSSGKEVNIHWMYLVRLCQVFFVVCFYRGYHGHIFMVIIITCIMLQFPDETGYTVAYLGSS